MTERRSGVRVSRGRSARLVAALLFVCSAGVLANVTAALDRTRITPGETVQLTLQRDSRGGGDPDLAPLAADFDILSRGSGSSVQVINGTVTTQRELQLQLSPKRSGRLVVPPVRWGAESSPPLVLDVAAGIAPGTPSAPGGGTPSAGPAAHVFLTATVDQPRPYVQSAVTLTVRLHADQPLYRASLELGGNNDVLVQQLGKDVQRSESVDGRSYQVVERKYVLLPQRSGALSLDGAVLDAQVADPRDPLFDRAFGTMRLPGVFNATRPLRLRGDPIALDVRPRPASLAGREWVPARNVTLEESWQPADGSVHVGEPLTRHVRITANGLTAAQLPDLSASMALPDGIKAYPDQAKLDDTEQGGTLVGRRDQDVALIASKPGAVTLPPLRVTWWDTARDAPREAVLPARVVDVLPAVGGTVGTPAAPDAAAPVSAAHPPSPAAQAAPSSPPAWWRDTPWPWVSAALALLWLATLGGWWRANRRRAGPRRTAADPLPPAKPRPSLSDAIAACKAGDPSGARRALIAWAATVWPVRPPAGLNAIAARVDDAALADRLRELDRVCYAGGPWDGLALAGALAAWRPAANNAPAATSPPDALGHLYP
jgi:hypothetical protein